MIAKDQNGNVSVLESRSHSLFGTVVGTATGALIGLVAGAPGAAVGALLAATTGLGADVVTGMLDADFVNSVRVNMLSGTTAIILEADEGSTRPIDDIVARDTRKTSPSNRKRRRGHLDATLAGVRPQPGGTNNDRRS